VQNPAFLYLVEVMNSSVEFAGHNDILSTFGKRVSDAVLAEVKRKAGHPDALVSLTADFYKAPHTHRNVLQMTIIIASSDGVLSYELDPIPAPESKTGAETAAVIKTKLTSLDIAYSRVAGVTTDSGMHTVCD